MANGDLNFNLSVGVNSALQSLSKVSEKIQQVGKDFEDISGKVTGFATGLAASLTALTTSAALFADELNDVAAANDTTIASILELGSALKGAGGEYNNSAKLIQTLTNNIESANSGNLKAVSTFNKLGISIGDLGDLSQTEIRNKLIKTLAEMQDPIERNALAFQVFGKAAAGVDWKQAAADIDNNRGKYDQYEQSLRTASDAVGSLEKIFTDLKIAAAQAFEPLLKFIANLKIEVSSLTVLLKVLAAVLAFAVSASVLSGFAKLVVIFKELNSVVSKNKLITIIGTLFSVGAGVATWAGLTKDVEEATKDVGDAQSNVQQQTEETKRDQTGLLDAIQKQKDTLTAITEQFNRQTQATRDKLSLEEKFLSVSEQEKRIIQETANIEQQTQTALASLKSKFEALDKDARNARAKDYEKERELIIQNGEVAKRDTEERIRNIQRIQNELKRFQDFIKEVNDVNKTQFDLLAKQLTDNAGYKERIDLEQKLLALTKLRATIGDGLTGLNQKENELAKQAITIATTRVQNLNASYEDINRSIDENIKAQVSAGIITQKVADAILKSNNDARIAIIQNAQEISNSQRRITEENRSFSTGWKKAFNDYVDNATNAAQAAQRIFQKTTQGMEDLIVNFAKTGKFEFRNFVNSILEELLRSQIRQTIAQIFSIGGRSSNTGGGILGSIGKLLGFANGGIIPTDSPVIVGERGPEILAGASGRQVIPNNALGGTTQVTYNINAVDARSFKELVASDPSFIYAVSQQGSRSLPSTRR